MRVPRQLLGWTAVALSTLAASFWAFWGIIENFHEGWYYRSFWMNVGMMLIQYLLPAILFVAAALTGIYWPRIGGAIHIIGAIAAAWYFHRSFAVVFLIAVPLALIGVAYAFGRPSPRQWAVRVIVAIPLVTIVGFGVYPAYRLSRRHDDGDRSARRITQNGVDLIWAPAGPGWPDNGVTWYEATRRCEYLRPDGLALAATPQNIWRLPTADEALRSMRRPPDKESPLWDVHSKVIYWWTATESDRETAKIVVYNGQVSRRKKSSHPGYLGFRAVKAPRATAPGSSSPAR
jgi:hypothetical protein